MLKIRDLLTISLQAALTTAIFIATELALFDKIYDSLTWPMYTFSLICFTLDKIKELEK